MKLLLKLSIFLFAVSTLGQKSFFETLAIHGEEAVYDRFYSVYKDDAGNQRIAGKQYQLKAEIIQFKNLNAGFKLIGATDKDLAGMVNFDVTLSKSNQFIGYPNVSLLVNRSSRKGYVAIDDYIFKLGNVWKEKDGLGFNDIDAIYIKVGSLVTETGKKKKKKKKFGAFMKKFKDAALNKEISECSSDACKKAQSMDLKKYILAYLSKMKQKQDNYSLTVQDKSEKQVLINAVNDYYKMVNSKNAAYWKSPEGQAILENRRRADASNKQTNVTIKNNTGRTIYIGTAGSRNPGIMIGKGSSATWNCKTDAYLQTRLKKDTNTFYYETSNRKVYTANSKCGATKVIN